MLIDLIKAFLLVFVAELGDKTQILAMTFATQYKVKEVLLGVFIGVLLNHGLAIILGQYLSRLIPMSSIQSVAGVMFLIFGILALKEEKAEESKKGKFGAIVGVALAFFIGELGDKTQLTAMTLSAESNNPILILSGTVLGMLGTSTIGIYVGGIIGEKMPDVSIKIVSSVVFIVFGTLRLYRWMPKEILSLSNIAIYLIVIVTIHLTITIRLVHNRKRHKHSPIKKAAASLHLQTKALKTVVDDICLGKSKCGECSGRDCIIGCMKMLLQKAGDDEQYYVRQEINPSQLKIKNFDTVKVQKALCQLMADYVRHDIIDDERYIINQIKGFLEIILVGKRIKFNGDLPKYIRQIKRINYHIGRGLEACIIDKMNISVKIDNKKEG